MQADGVEPNHCTFVSLLKACGAIQDIIRGLHLHADAIRKGFAFNAYVGNTLLSMYGKCGALVEAEVIFCSLPERSIVSWNAMLSTYLEQGQGERALLLYRQLQDEGPSPNRLTFVIILQACSILADQEEAFEHPTSVKLGSLQIVQGLHAVARLKNLAFNVFVGTALLRAYSKCRAFLEAEHFFSIMSQHDVVAWNVMLSAYVEQGQSYLALLAYKHLYEKGLSPNKQTFVIALLACSMLAEEKAAPDMKGQIKAMSLEIGRALHADADASSEELTSNNYCGTALLSMYGKCRDIVEAERVFAALPQRDLVSWNAMLSAYINQGDGESALLLFRQMLDDSVSSNQMTLILACQACSILAEKEQSVIVHEHSIKDMSLEIGRALHGDARKKGLGSFVATTFMTFYGKCGAMLEAEHMFSEFPHQDTISWTALVSSYVEQGQSEKALWSYRKMQEEGTCPNQHTFVYSLQACVKLAGKEESFPRNKRSNKLMALEIGRALHADAFSKHFAVETFVGTALLSMYGECGSPLEAESVFNTMSQRDVVSWNTMLSTYIKQGEAVKALQLYRNLKRQGICGNQLTITIALQACISLGENIVKKHSMKSMHLVIGQALHADARRIEGYVSESIIGNALVNMYSALGTIAEVENVFTRQSERDVQSWNSMLLAYLEQDQEKQALHLYIHMQEEGISPNQATFVIILRICSTLAERENMYSTKQQLAEGMIVEIIEAVHGDANKQGVVDDSFTAYMIIMYGKMGIFSRAEDVFSAQSQPALESWNALLFVYTEQCQGDKALLLHKHMLKKGKAGNHVTLTCLLQACCNTCCLDSCRQFHFDIVSVGYELILSVAACLTRTYGSCASMLDSQSVLGMLWNLDVVSWTACIAGHAELGDALASLHVFEEVKMAGMEPDELLCSLVLQACSHTGLVFEGANYFESMTIDHGLFPGLKQYGALIDGVGRAGNFRIAENMLVRLQMKADVTMWSSLMSMCRIHSNVPLAEVYFDHAINLQPKQVGAYVLMANIYAEAAWQECG